MLFGAREPNRGARATRRSRPFPGVSLPPPCHLHGIALPLGRLHRVWILAAKLSDGHPIGLPPAIAIAVGARLRASVLANLMAPREAFIAGYPA